MFLTPISIILSTLCITYAKVYERCELARELRNFDLPEDEIPTWVCIAQHESDYNTSAMNPGSGDHGLFQISQLYWCSPPGDGYGCNSPCSKFRDDDIADDLQCIRRIYNEHIRISGDGFNAWVVYPLFCKNDTSKYAEGCFDQEYPVTPDVVANATENEIPYEEVDEYGDGYQFPALPRAEQKNASETINLSHRYEFANLPFSRISIKDSVPIEDTRYNFSDAPASKQSIDEFTAVQMTHENPKFKIDDNSEYELDNTQNSVLKKDTGRNFPNFPFSKESIHEFKSVHEKEVLVDGTRYNFPKFPSSKQSIHEFTPIHRPEKDTIFKAKDKTKQDLHKMHNSVPVEGTIYNFPKFPSSKESIHEFKSVHNPKEDKDVHKIHDSLPVEGTTYNFPKFPSSKESIHEFKSVYRPEDDTIFEIKYNFPKFPSSKQSIHEFTSVHRPEEDTIFKSKDKTKQDLHKIHASVSEKGTIYNFPKFPSSKESMHEFKSIHSPDEDTIFKTSDKTKQDVHKIHDSHPVEGTIYNFPKFPSSKESIHEFKSVYRPEDDTVFEINEKTKQDLHKVYDSVPVKGMRYNFPKFPSSKESIHEFKSAQRPEEDTIFETSDKTKQDLHKVYDSVLVEDTRYNFPKFPSSKQSIHEFKSVYSPEDDKVVPRGKTKQDPYKMHDFVQVEDTKYDIPSNKVLSNKVTHSQKDTLEDLRPKLTTLTPKFKSTSKLTQETLKPLISTSHSSSKITSLKTTTPNPISSKFLPQSTAETLSKPTSNSFYQKTATKTHRPYTKSYEENSEYKVSSQHNTTKNTSQQLAQNNEAKTYQKDTSEDSRFTSTSLTKYKTIIQNNSESSKPITKTYQNEAKVTSFKINTLTSPSSTTESPVDSTKDTFYKKNQATTNKPYTTRPNSLTTDSKLLETSTKYYSTPRKPILSSKSFSATSQPSSTRIISKEENLKPVSLGVKPIISTTTLLDTTSKPLTTTVKFTHSSVSKQFSKFKSSIVTSRPVTNYLTTKKPFTKHDHYDLQGASSTLTPFTAVTTTSKPFLTSKTFTTTSPKSFTTKNISFGLSKLATATIKPFSTLKPIISTATLLDTASKPITTTVRFTHSSVSKEFSKFKSSIVTSRPVTNYLTTKKPFIKHDYYDLQGASSTLTPFTARTTTSKPFLKSKTFTTTSPKSLTTKNISFGLSKLATATIKPLSTIKPRTVTYNQFITHKVSPETYNSQTTTVKSPLTFKPVTVTTFHSLVTQKVSFKPSKFQTTTLKPPLTISPFTITTSKPFITQKESLESSKLQTTTFKPPLIQNTSFVRSSHRNSTNTTSKLFTQPTTKQDVSQSFTTTRSSSKPLSKQVTFAPDSFFSLLFGSQTLPPLVPPGRPPRPPRPSGERPGGLPATLRPPRPERPGGLPRPPSRPPRPERPNRRRPENGLSGIQEAFRKGPEFEIASTESPFSHGSAGTSRPSLFQKRPDRIAPIIERSSTSSKPLTTPVPRRFASKEVGKSDRQFSNNTSQTNSFKTKPKPKSDEDAVEVKIDDNYVFLRTRFGYRLSRNIKQ